MVGVLPRLMYVVDKAYPGVLFHKFLGVLRDYMKFHAQKFHFVEFGLRIG
jgi:hypothetical protein